MLPEVRGEHSVGFCDIETQDILVRLYYPSKSKPRYNELGLWFPSKEYLRAYSHLTGHAYYLSYALVSLFYRNTRLQATENAEIADLDDIPVVLFSHGLKGVRTTYSYIACDFASRGYLVVYLEHRDGSATFTTIKGEPLPLRVKKEEEDEFEMRNSQLKKRVEEVSLAMDLIKSLKNGDSIVNLFPQKLPKNHFKVSDLKDKINMDKLVFCGHSFGAATVVACHHLYNVRCVCIFDAWMFPLETIPTPKVPILSINSSNFHWPANLEKLFKFLKLGSQSVYCTVQDSCHYHHSDFMFMLPGFMKRKIGTQQDPKYFLDTNQDLCMRFIEGDYLVFDSPPVDVEVLDLQLQVE